MAKQIIASTEDRTAASAAQSAMQPRVFDLTGTSITTWQTNTTDIYQGPFAELLAAGIVRNDQLPAKGSRAISWVRGERAGRSRVSIDETYVRVWVRPDNLNVGLGVPKLVQQARRRAEKEKYEAYGMAAAAERRDAQAAASRKAVKALAEMPKSREAFLREEAKCARRMALIAVKMATEASNHGYQIDSNAMDEIHESIDALVQAFLNADVTFDAIRQAAIIAQHQRNILDADPSIAAQLKVLAVPNPRLLQGEAA